MEKGKEKVTSLNPDSLGYIEKKLVDQGFLRKERHPVDGLTLAHPPPKSGHGGKFTWEGPVDIAHAELDPVPPAIDEHDPNYVPQDQEPAEEISLIIGEVEVAKVAEAKEGVSTIHVEPPLLSLLP